MPQNKALNLLCLFWSNLCAVKTQKRAAQGKTGWLFFTLKFWYESFFCINWFSSTEVLTNPAILILSEVQCILIFHLSKKKSTSCIEEKSSHFPARSCGWEISSYCKNHNTAKDMFVVEAPTGIQKLWMFQIRNEIQALFGMVWCYSYVLKCDEIYFFLFAPKNKLRSPSRRTDLSGLLQKSGVDYVWMEKRHIWESLFCSWGTSEIHDIVALCHQVPLLTLAVS